MFTKVCCMRSFIGARPYSHGVVAHKFIQGPVEKMAILPSFLGRSLSWPYLRKMGLKEIPESIILASTNFEIRNLDQTFV